MRQLLELPPGAYAPGGTNGATECCTPAPTIGQALGLRHRGEQLSVEELIVEPAIERFRESVLPGGSWRDISRAGGGAGLTPVP